MYVKDTIKSTWKSNFLMFQENQEFTTLKKKTKQNKKKTLTKTTTLPSKNRHPPEHSCTGSVHPSTLPLTTFNSRCQKNRAKILPISVLW